MIKVLFVEDDPEQIFLFGKAFGVKGLSTVAAGNSDETFRAIHSGKPDVILLDIMLQNENGLDIAEKIRQEKDLRDIPIFVFTNSDKQEYVDRAERLGIEKYIIKSGTTPGEMAERIKDFMVDGNSGRGSLTE